MYDTILDINYWFWLVLKLADVYFSSIFFTTYLMIKADTYIYKFLHSNVLDASLFYIYFAAFFIYLIKFI